MKRGIRPIACVLVLGAACLWTACDLFDDDDPTQKLVFVTSSDYTGNLAGLSGGDQLCQDLADAAGLPGDYKAWLGDSTGSPDTRFLKSNGPYVRTDGTRVADDWSDLTDGNLLNPINVDETGTDFTGISFAVWTGVAVDGTLAQPPAHCSDWSTDASNAEGYVGSYPSPSSDWTNELTEDCDNSYPIYCFQQ